MKTLSIVIPLYNEDGRISATLNILEKGFKYDGLKLEKLIFVDDGSTDNTVAKILQHKKMLAKALKCPVKLITYQPNKGRGHAIRFATFICKSDYVLYLDADMSIPLTNLNRICKSLDMNYDLMFGSKKKPGARAVIPRSFTRNIVGFGHSVVASLFLGVFAWDYQGGFKIFSRRLILEVFPQLTVDRWGFDMEIIFLAKKLGFKTLEVPVMWSHKEQGSKVKLMRDIFRSLREMILIRMNWINNNYTVSAVTKSPSVSYSIL